MDDISKIENEPAMPRWMWFFIALVAGYVVWACFALGVRHDHEAQRDRIIAAHLEAMKNPPKMSLPEHLLDYDKFVEDNKVEGK